MSEFGAPEWLRVRLEDSDEITKELGVKVLDRYERLKSEIDEKLYQAFKAGCISANDGIFPGEFEEEIRILFEVWKNGNK